MAVNVPVYNTDNFSFGPGILYAVAITSTVAGVSEAADVDTSDVGAVRSGGQFQITRSRLDVNQGSPTTLVKQYVTAEDAQLTVNGIEWDLTKIQLALGAGVLSTSATAVTLGFGGDLELTNCAVKFVHVMPSGNTMTLRIWNAQGTGEMTITFGDDLHEFPYSFRALNAGLSGWDNLALVEKERLFQLEVQLAP